MPKYEWRARASDTGDLLPDEGRWHETRGEAELEAAKLRTDADPPFDDVWIEQRSVGRVRRMPNA